MKLILDLQYLCDPGGERIFFLLSDFIDIPTIFLLFSFKPWTSTLRPYPLQRLHCQQDVRTTEYVFCWLLTSPFDVCPISRTSLTYLFTQTRWGHPVCKESNYWMLMRSQTRVSMSFFPFGMFSTHFALDSETWCVSEPLHNQSGAPDGFCIGMAKSKGSEGLLWKNFAKTPFSLIQDNIQAGSHQVCCWLALQ